MAKQIAAVLSERKIGANAVPGLSSPMSSLAIVKELSKRSEVR